MEAHDRKEILNTRTQDQDPVTHFTTIYLQFISIPSDIQCKNNRKVKHWRLKVQILNTSLSYITLEFQSIEGRQFMGTRGQGCVLSLLMNQRNSRKVKLKTCPPLPHEFYQYVTSSVCPNITETTSFRIVPLCLHPLAVDS